MCTTPFLSIVIPVYNVVDYLEETLDSVISSSVAEETSFEVILQDDGSTDGSREICEEYQRQYPDIVRYYRQDNSGVATALNNAINRASGRIVGILGSDDKYGDGTFNAVKEFFTLFEDEVELACLPIHLFDAQNKPHMLNYKFNHGSRIVDIDSDYEDILLHSGGLFFLRSSWEKYGLQFDLDVPMSEDTKLIAYFVSKTRKYGLISAGKYLYRKRTTKTSLIDTSVNNPDAFSKTITNVWEEIATYGTNQRGEVSLWFQNVIAYELQWRVKAQNTILDDEENLQYKKIIGDLLKRIDDSVIFNQKYISTQYKIHELRLKYGEDPFLHAKQIGVGYWYKDRRLIVFNENMASTNLYVVEKQGNSLRLQGYFNGFRAGKAQHGFLVDDSFVPVIYVTNQPGKELSLGDVVYDKNAFDVVFPVSDGTEIVPAVRLDNGKIIHGKIHSFNNSGVPPVHMGYRIIDNLILTNIGQSKLVVSKASFANIISSEVSFLGRVLLPRHNKLYSLSRLSFARYRLRALFHLLFPHSKKVWLVSDRPDYAGDNGEAFFRYLSQHKPKDISVYFLLSKNAPEYKELKKLGTIINPRSRKAANLFLQADKIISSQADDYVLNPFAKDETLMRGLFHFDFIFVQHGVLSHDLSGWLNKYSKNIKVFVTSAPSEYDSVANSHYGYSQDDVALTGLPRFDRLINVPEKKIIIAPTWRKYLRGSFDPIKKAISYNPEFKTSRYFTFWQQLIQDPRINSALVKFGYTAEFWLHPSHFVQYADFQRTDTFSVSKPPHDYNKGISSAALFVTDYSSVVSDLAYLEKPVIYSHFDAETFNNNHIYSEGFFSYERDGFGPVCYDYEETVNAILKAIENNCVMEDRYRGRSSQFFAFHDKNNSQRVMDAILNLDMR